MSEVYKTEIGDNERDARIAEATASENARIAEAQSAAAVARSKYEAPEVQRTARDKQQTSRTMWVVLAGVLSIGVIGLTGGGAWAIAAIVASLAGVVGVVEYKNYRERASRERGKQLEKSL